MMLAGVEMDGMQKQHNDMRYFVHLSDSHIASNSAAVMSQLALDSVIRNVEKESNQSYAFGRIDPSTTKEAIELAINTGMRRQRELDQRQLFLCSVMHELPEENVVT